MSEKNTLLLELLKRAATYVNKREANKASHIYHRILSGIPGQPDAVYGLYVCAKMQGDTLRAKRHLFDAINAHAINHPRDINAKLQQHWMKNFVEQFGELYPKFKKTNKSPVNKIKNTSVSLAKKKPQKALDYLNKNNWELNEDNYVNALHLDLCIRYGETKTALKLAFKLLENGYEVKLILLLLGKLFFDTGNTYGALTAYHRLLKEDAKNSKALSAMAAVYLGLEKAHLALPLLKESVKLNAEDWTAQINLSSAYSSLSLYTELSEHLKFLLSKFEKRKVELLRTYGSLAINYPSNQNVDFFQQSAVDLNPSDQVVDLYQGILTNKIDKVQSFSKLSERSISAKSTVPIFNLTPIGRSGSLFFQSLLDGHPMIHNIPGVGLKGFFSDETLVQLYQSRKHEAIVEKFVEIFEAIFDSESPKLVPGNPMSGNTSLGNMTGLNILGENKDIPLRISQSKFKENMMWELSQNKKDAIINPGELFVNIHKAWSKTVGHKTTSDTIFYHGHNLTVTDAFKYHSYFTKSHNIFIVRDFVPSFDSWLDLAISGPRQELEKGNDVLEEKFFESSYLELCGRFEQLAKMYSMAALSPTQNYIIKLEDLKANPELYMKKISEVLNVEYDHSMLRSEFCSLKYWGPPSKKNKNIEGFQKNKNELNFFDADDHSIFETIYSEWYEVCDYKRTKDNYKNMATILSGDELFPWEKSLAAEFKFGEAAFKRSQRFHSMRAVINHYKKMASLKQLLEKNTLVTL